MGSVYVRPSQHGKWAKQREKTLTLLQEMREGVLTDNMSGFSAAIARCEKGGHWGQALGLPHKMRESGKTATVISFSAAIRGCAKSWHIRCV